MCDCEVISQHYILDCKVQIGFYHFTSLPKSNQDSCFTNLKNCLILTFAKILKCDHSNESCRLLVELSCGTVYDAIEDCLKLESVGANQKCDYFSESCRVELSCGAVYHAVQGGSNF